MLQTLMHDFHFISICYKEKLDKFGYFSRLILSCILRTIVFKNDAIFMDENKMQCQAPKQNNMLK